MINSLDITVGGNGEIVETAKRFVWDEPVVCEQLRSVHMVESKGRKVPKQDLVPVYGVFGRDSRAFLGMYGKKEHVLSNQAFANEIESRLNALGLAFERKVTLLTGNYENSQCELEYTLQGVGFGNGTERYDCVIRGLTSYDRTTNTSLSMEARRLICLNGAYGLVNTKVFLRRHSEGLSAFLRDQLAKSIDASTVNLSSQITAIERFEIKPEQRFHILRNMYQANGLRFSGLAARRIEAMVAAPTADEVNLAPFPQLYQASMRYFRDLDNGQVTDSKGNKQAKPELSRRMGEYVGSVLAALPNTPKFQEQLLKPADESVYDRLHKVSHIIAR